MDLVLLFIVGLIFLTCFYGLTMTYVASWILVIGLVFSSFVLGLLIASVYG